MIYCLMSHLYLNDVQYLECHVPPFSVALEPGRAQSSLRMWPVKRLIHLQSLKKKRTQKLTCVLWLHSLLSAVWRWSNVRRLYVLWAFSTKKDSAIKVLYYLYKIKEDIWSRSSLLIFILRLIRFCSHGLFLCSLPVACVRCAWIPCNWLNFV